MYTIVVRAKKDADAVKAMLRVFYRGWDIKVKTLRGVRSLEQFRDKLLDAIDQDRFNIVLIGREDLDKMEIEHSTPLNVYFSLVPREKVRNARLPTLREAFERGRAKFRNTVFWNGTYIFSKSSGTRLSFEPLPAYDNFMIFGNRGIGVLARFLGELRSVLLLVRKLGGEHEVYSGPHLIGKLKIPDLGEVSSEIIRNQEVVTNIEKVIDANKRMMSLYEKLSLKLLENLKDKYTTVVVPWSGGRDSTATLILASKVFRKRFYAVYVDMELEFTPVREYIERVSKILGVKLLIARVKLGDEVRKRGFPSHKDRWCTKLKIKALHEKIAEVAEGEILIVVGDRDAESELRSKRPPVRPDGRYMQVAPIKNWSASQAQIYILQNKIPLNPLYSYGFYRLGCWICPALRSWERYIMKTYRKELLRDVDQKLLDNFLALD